MFISLEGIDGSGKSTQAKMLAAAFKTQGFDVVLTREMGGTEFGEKTRDLIMASSTDDMTEFLMICAARNHHLHAKILPALKANQVVICDRFVDSSAAYQGQTLGMNLVYEIHNRLLMGIYPNLTLYLDISPMEAQKRVHSRGQQNKFDQRGQAFYESVRASYLEVAKRFSRVHIFDANLEKGALHAKMLRCALKQL